MSDEHLLYIYTVMLKTIPEPNNISAHIEVLSALYDELINTKLGPIADEVTDLYSGRTLTRIRGDDDDKA